jgi:hypothetical protein
MIAGHHLRKPDDREKRIQQLIGIFRYIISDYELTLPGSRQWAASTAGKKHLYYHYEIGFGL